MQTDDGTIMLDMASKFFKTTYLKGWFHHETEQLADVTVEARGPTVFYAEVMPNFPGLPEKYQGYVAQASLAENRFPEDAILVPTT
jgi:hypothetical protein